MIIAGIDEAGRGPCFGPMAISIALIDDSIESELKKEGVKDSKQILPNKREKLIDFVKEKCIEYATIIIEPKEINTLMAKYSLNEIEAMKAAELINKLDEKPEKIFIDSPDNPAKNFEARIRKYLTKENENVKIISENKADSNYVVVSAASILAKVTRDREIEKMIKKYGDFGSGYPSDPKTQEYLRTFVRENKKLPIFSRIFWKTCENALAEMDSTQTKL